MQAAEEEYKKRQDKVLKLEEELLKVKEDNEKNASEKSNDHDKDDGLYADNMEGQNVVNSTEKATEQTTDFENDLKKDIGVDTEQESKNSPSSKEKWREKMNAVLGEKASVKRK